MEDLKQIQEFFSKPLEENTFKKGDKVTYLGHPAVVTATKEYNGRNFVSVSYDKGMGKTKASDILATSGDVKAVNEMDINDPVLMKMRAAKSSKPDFGKAYGDAVKTAYGNDKNAKKIAFLKKERAQLMRDMEQEAEPEGGPIADEYGSKLDRIDAAIAKLSGRKEMTYDQAINEELNLPNYGKVTPPKGGASLVGQYNSIQGKSKYDTVIFDYQEGSDKPYGIVQVEGHGIYGSDLLKRLGLRQTKSWTAGVDVYIHDGNYTPVYVSEGDFKTLLDFWSGGLDREAKAQSDFYRGRGNTSGTIDEATEEDKIDIITMDVPLFIRVLEYAREDAQEDMDLHDLAEKAISSTKQQGILQMDDYDMLVGEMEPIDESVNLKQSKLSSSEYQKAKKLKAFNAKDWKWNADEDLYVKVIKESKNYIGKNQITKGEFANLKNKTITYEGSKWNVMDSNEFTIEIKNEDGDTKIVNYAQFTKKGLVERILKKLKENKIK